MHAPLEVQATITDEHVKIQDDRLILHAQVAPELPLPEQDAELPGRLEAGIERGGRPLKRRLSRHAVEQADTELILARRRGKDGQGIARRGATPFTFEAAFGAGRVRRRRIEPQADGTTEVPAAHVRQTPRRVALTPGPRHAACDRMLRDPARQTAARIDARAGGEAVPARTTVLEIVHHEGRRLRAAAHARAEAIYARDPEALRVQQDLSRACYVREHRREVESAVRHA